MPLLPASLLHVLLLLLQLRQQREDGTQAMVKHVKAATYITACPFLFSLSGIVWSCSCFTSLLR
jgi:hypothetical protein